MNDAVRNGGCRSDPVLERNAKDSLTPRLLGGIGLVYFRDDEERAT